MERTNKKDGRELMEIIDQESKRKSGMLESEDQRVFQMDTKVSWLICMCSLISNIIIIGCLYTFGIIFPKILEEFQEGKAKTAIIASLGLALYTFMCPVASKLSQRFGCRKVMVVSGVTSAVGLLGSSFATHLEVLYLSFGVMVGIASSLVYMAAFQAILLYFEKKRDFAMVTVSVGPMAGVLVMSPVMQVLLEHFDWRKTLLILAGLNLLPSILGCIITRKKVPATNGEEDDVLVRPRRPLTGRGFCRTILEMVDFSVLKIPGFVILSLSSGSIALLGLSIPFIHLAKHALEIGIPDHLASWVIFAIGPASVVARILSGRLLNTGWISYLRMFQLIIFLFSLDNFLAPMATTFASLMVYSVVYGICDGSYGAPILCMIMNWYGPSALGWFFFFQGFSFFLSPVIAGLISDITGSYHYAFYTAGVLLVISCCLSQLVKCFKTKSNELRSLESEELVVVQRETVL